MIDYNMVRFLLGSHKLGVCFETVLTLGCQEINHATLDVAEAFRLSRSELNVPISLCTSRELFSLLGTKVYDEMDVSDYEGANIIHNLNDPVPDHLRNKYDVVHDGGTLEHVFNIAEGIRGAMKMVKVGGHLILHNPSNNWFGHGFYQTSPEFYFRALAPENGFEIIRIVAHDTTDQWYEVKDPNEARGRVELFGTDRILSLVCARKTAEKEIFSTWPTQSDYSALWADGERKLHGHEGQSFRSRIKNSLPSSVLRWMRRHIPSYYREYSFGNRSHFTKVTDY